jgi:hypothetical protein
VFNKGKTTMTDKSASGRGAYIYIIQLDIPAEHEADFNRIYDTQHVPAILQVPGVHGCYRYRLEYADDDATPRYLALYELDSPEVTKSDAWRAAADSGDWAPKIRPYTQNRKRQVMKRIN